MHPPATAETLTSLDALATALARANAQILEIEKALLHRRIDLRDQHTKTLSGVENAATYLEDVLARVGMALWLEAEDAPRTADAIAWDRQTRPQMGKPILGGV